MARFDHGWTKNHRALERHWVGEDGWAYALFLRLISWANYEESKKFIKGEIIVIRRGQLLTSVRELANSFGFDRSTVERRLQAFEKDGMIVRELRHPGTIITICNYDKYQCIEGERETANRHETSHSTATRPANPPALNKEVKKERTKEVKNSLPSAPLSGVFNSLASDWLKFAQTEMPWKTSDAKWTILNFEIELERIARIMDLNLFGLQSVLEFIRKDEFWRKNAVSPFGLLKKSSKNDLRKIDNIITRMRTKQNRVDDVLQRFVDSDDEYVSPFDVGKK